MIKPSLLPQHDGHADIAGYLMAALSLSIITTTGGLTLLLALIHVWRTARAVSSHASGKHVVVLGKRLQNNTPDHDYRARLDRAIALFRVNSQRLIYLPGGTTGNAGISEARAGQTYLLEQGVDARHIQLEQASRNTLENLRHLYTDNAIPESRITLVTNRYHLARASVMAHQFGFKVTPCAAEASPAKGIIARLIYIKEALLLHWFLTGLLYATLTRNKAMLNRICR